MLSSLLSAVLLTSLSMRPDSARSSAASTDRQRSRRHKSSAAASSSSAAAAAASESRRRRIRPNVVLLLADDLGHDLGCVGHPYARTPHIDSLAADGTLFTNFHVTGATCSPSRTGIMTGLHPLTFPNYPGDWGFMGAATITELCQDAGYEVGHFGKWHVGPTEADGTYGIDEIEIIGGKRRDPMGRDAETYAAAMEFINSTVRSDPDVPFYVNVWGHISHSPVVPPEAMVELFQNVTLNPDDFGHHMKEKIEEFERTDKGAERHMQEYVAEVYALDLQVGMLLNLLDELGIRDDTIVAFTSDHGPTPAYIGHAGPYRGGKAEFYEGGVRVPFLLRWTGEGKVPGGRVSDALISGLDWTPTLCRLLKLPSCDPDRLEGEDVSDVWLGRSSRSRTAPLVWSLEDDGRRAMLYDDYKLHLPKGDLEDARDEGELYDLRSDPEELNNLFFDESHRERRDAMTAKMREWTATLPTEHCKDSCDKPLAFNPDGGINPGICPSASLLLMRRRMDDSSVEHGTTTAAALFTETFESKGGMARGKRSIRRMSAPSLPAGAVGSQVGRVSFPESGRRRSVTVAHDVSIPLNGAGNITISASVGLDPRGDGAMSFQLGVKFDTGRVMLTHAARVHGCGREAFVRYDRTAPVPEGAASVTRIAMKFRSLTAGAKDRFVLVDDVTVAAEGAAVTTAQEEEEAEKESIGSATAPPPVNGGGSLDESVLDAIRAITVEDLVDRGNVFRIPRGKR